MTFTKTEKDLQSLYLDISNLDLRITPEQFEQLYIDNPELQLGLTKDGKIITPSSDSLGGNEDIVHTFNHRGEPFTYDIKDLYWDLEAYNYLKEQEKLFDQCLPGLIKEYASKYVVFENNHVIDSDEDNLLSRIARNDSYNDKPAILCMFVPASLVENKANSIYEDRPTNYKLSPWPVAE